MKKQINAKSAVYKKKYDEFNSQLTKLVSVASEEILCADIIRELESCKLIALQKFFNIFPD